MTPCRGKGRALVLALILLFTVAVFAWLFLSSPPIVIRWQTETEVDTVAFNVLRAEDDAAEFETVNPLPIPAAGSALTGGDYSYADQTARRGHTYTYQLQEITSQGNVVTYDWRTSAQARRSWTDIISSLLFLFIMWGAWLWYCRDRTGSSHRPDAGSGLA